MQLVTNVLLLVLQDMYVTYSGQFSNFVLFRVLSKLAGTRPT